MAAVKDLVSVEEYLDTVYEPDCDYVDGELVDRNVGERDHAHAQGEVFFHLRQGRKKWNIYPSVEARVQVSPTRFRVPDVCAFIAPAPAGQIFTHPPFLCVEILSPEDRMSRVQQKIDDYLAFGVEYVWLINPQTRRAWVYRRDGIREIRDGTLRTANPDIEISLTDVFAEDDTL